MKIQFRSITVKSILVLVLAAGLSFSVSANTNPGLVNPEAAKISFNGQQKDQLKFKVEYKNLQAEPFTLIVKNDNNVVYTRKFDSRPLTLDLLLEEVPENCNLTFTIKSATTDHSQKFEVKKETTSVNEFFVKGL